MPTCPKLFGLIVLIGGCMACGETESDPPIVGGSCGYQDYPGTCSGTADNTFTFEGVIADETVSYTGNTLYGSETLAEGESVSCTLSWITSGTCTPCVIDIGECGAEAWDDQPEE